MVAHILVIPDWIPCSDNEFRQHWSKVARLKRSDRNLVGIYAMMQRIPKATGKRRLQLTVTVANASHMVDPSNLYKSLLDACVAAGLLLDDSAAYLEIVPAAVLVGEKRSTQVTFEDVEP